MGHVDQASRDASAVVDAEAYRGALVCRLGAIEDAGVQLSDEGGIGEFAGNVRAGLGAVSKDIETLAAIAQSNAGDQCVVRIAFIALYHQRGCESGVFGGLARFGLGVQKPGEMFSGAIRRGPEILLRE